jgi:hypothetical protein
MKKLIYTLFTLCSIFMTTSLFAAEESPVFELRVYTTHPGKMPDLLKRFTNHTTKIFEKHGMENVGYWLATDEKDKNKLYYILKYKNRAAADAAWKAFVADPEWIKVRSESEANGPIVAGVESIFMTSTEFSAIK